MKADAVLDLANALHGVLLFHTSGGWSYNRQQLWQDLMGTKKSTPAEMCKVIRERLVAAGFDPERPGDTP